MITYFVNFENQIKDDYSDETLFINGVQFSLQRCLIGHQTRDKKHGERSLRMAPLHGEPAVFEMTDFKEDGVGSLSFYCANFGFDYWHNSPLKIFLTTNDIDWIEIGRAEPPFSNSLEMYSFQINIDSPIKLRFILESEVDLSARRINIDDISITKMPSYFIDFEDASKNDYNSESLFVNEVLFDFQRSLIGSQAKDKKFGMNSLRMSPIHGEPAVFEMVENKLDGVGSLSFYYANFGFDYWHEFPLVIESSEDNGVSWQVVEEISPPFPTVMTYFSKTIKKAVPIRFRFRLESNTLLNARRINVDNILITGQWAWSSSSSSSESSESSLSSSSSSSSSSSVIKASTLPFSIRSVNWEVSRRINNSFAVVSYKNESSSSSSYPSYRNVIAQSQRVLRERLNVRRVALYLGKRLGDFLDYNVVVSLYEADVFGVPTTYIKSVQRPASDFSSERWYFFEMDLIDYEVSETQMICILYHQEGGDNLNCVPCFYATNPLSGIDSGSICYIASELGEWEELRNKSLTFKFINIVDMFEEAYSSSTEHRIITSPGEEMRLALRGEKYLEKGVQNGFQVKIVPEESHENVEGVPYIEIEPVESVNSIVIDNSGSMVWGDRTQKRFDLAKSIARQINENSPSKSYFDVVEFYGVSDWSSEDFNLYDFGEYVPIAVDLSSPRSVLPNADGTAPSLRDGIVAYGLDKLEEGHTYVISKIVTSAFEVIIEDGMGIYNSSSDQVEVLNFLHFGHSTNDVEFNVRRSGPGSEVDGNGWSAIEAEMMGNNHLKRNIQTNRKLEYLKLKEDVLIDSMEARTFFQEGRLRENQNISIIDSNGTDPFLKISEISETDGQVTFDSFSKLNFKRYESEGRGVIQENIVSGAMTFQDLDSGLNLFIKDENSNRNVEFYLETSKGGRLIWEIAPLRDWERVSLFYMDQIANLSFEFFHSDGEPIPDGSTLYLLGVQEMGDLRESRFKIKEFFPPTNQVVVEINDVFEQTSFESIEERHSIMWHFPELHCPIVHGFVLERNFNLNEGTIVFAPSVLNFDETPSHVEFKAPLSQMSLGEEIPLDLQFVDITPFVVGRSLDNSLLKDHDAEQVDPDVENINYYNDKEDFFTHLPTNTPSLRQSSSLISTLHLLPILYDKLTNGSEKNEKLFSSNVWDVSETHLALLNRLQNRFLELTEEVPTQEPLETLSEIDEENDEELKTYTIETPVTFRNGFANSAMTTHPQRALFIHSNSGFDESFSDFGEEERFRTRGFIGEEFLFHPRLLVKNSLGEVSSTFSLEDFKIYSKCPFQIFSSIAPIDKFFVFKTKCILPGDADLGIPDEEGSREALVPGAYASSGEIREIKYIVSFRGHRVRQGFLKIKIFDVFRRSSSLINNPEEIIPPLKEFIESAPDHASCESPLYHNSNFITPGGGGHFEKAPETLGLTSQKVPFYFKQEGDLDFFFSSPYREATYLEDYQGEFQIPISNGEASFKIKAPETVVAKLMIYAQFEFPNNRMESIIKPDPIWFANPLEIEWITPTSPLLAETFYNFEARITFMGEPVPENVLLRVEGSEHCRFLGYDEDDEPEFGTWPRTTTLPSVGKTIQNGVVSSIRIGKHGTVLMRAVEDSDGSTSWIGDYETFTVSTSYLGWRCEDTYNFEWINGQEESVGPDFLFHSSFRDIKGRHVSQQNAIIYANGFDTLWLLVDLTVQSFENQLVEFYPFLMGINEFVDEDPSFIRFEEWGIRQLSSDKPDVNGIEVGGEQAGEINSGFAILDISQVSVIKERLSEPIAIAPSVRVKSDKREKDDPSGLFLGLGTHLSPEGFWSLLDFAVESGESLEKDRLHPSFVLKEPLSVKPYCPNPDSPSDFHISRISNSNFIFEVSFSGMPIPIFALENGVTRSSAFLRPTAFFRLFFQAGGEIDHDAIDLVIPDNAQEDISHLLDHTSCQVYYISSSNEAHYHRCEINYNGDGECVKTYDFSGNEIEGHSHQIENYELGFGEKNGVSHRHLIKSVISVSIEPSYNIQKEICLYVDLEYDASKRHIKREVEFRFCSDLRDSWLGDFSYSLRTPSDVFLDEFWRWNRSPSQDPDGVVFRSVLSNNSNPSLLTDGERVAWELSAFIPDKQKDSSFSLRDDLSFSNFQKMLILNIRSRMKVFEDVEVVDEHDIVFWANENSLPVSRALLSEITDDVEWVCDSMPTKTKGGVSPLFDAIWMAASRNINFQMHHDKPLACSLYILTDGDENSSGRNALQAIDSILRMSGGAHLSPFFVYIGSLSEHEMGLMGYLADNTGGKVEFLPAKGLDAVDFVESHLATNHASNIGLYKNEIDLHAKKIIKEITVDIVIPDGARAVLHLSVGNDKRNLTKLENSITIMDSEPIDIRRMIREPCQYVLYEIYLYGNNLFESPRLKGVSVSAIEAQKHFIIFSPIKIESRDEFISEAIINHKIISEGYSTIQYGMMHSNSIEEIDFFGEEVPLVKVGKRHILLSRHNEIATTQNNFNFILKNGSWDDSLKIKDVYIINLKNRHAILANQSDFVATPRGGMITFRRPIQREEGEEIVLSVTFEIPSQVQIICVVTNYEEHPTFIEHIGISYCKTQRTQKSVLPISVEKSHILSSSSSSE